MKEQQRCVCLLAEQERGMEAGEQIWACRRGGGDTAWDNWTIKSHKGTDTYTMGLRETITLQ